MVWYFEGLSTWVHDYCCGHGQAYSNIIKEDMNETMNVLLCFTMEPCFTLCMDTSLVDYYAYVIFFSQGVYDKVYLFQNW